MDEVFGAARIESLARSMQKTVSRCLGSCVARMRSPGWKEAGTGGGRMVCFLQPSEPRPAVTIQTSKSARRLSDQTGFCSVMAGLPIQT